VGQPYIFNIQRFSTHDGPGLRTTVFFKGCPLRCPWCHNPESINFTPEVMTDLEGKTETVGRLYSLDELVAECLTDTLFFDQSGGGVTLSGGEVMAQDFGYVLELVTRLRAAGVRVAIDTCGLAPSERFEAIAPLTDLFLFDFKFLDEMVHKLWTGASNRLILKNLELLGSLGARLHVRLILLDGLNTAEDQVEAKMVWLKAHGVQPEEVNLLPYHRFGIDKAAKLGRELREFTTPGDATVARIEAQVRRFFPRVTVGG
jgi:pyruvate formate lyase activating enzyme